jgi:protein-S-isoprenylcysteine O-methyltransferase Ste14
MDTNQYIGFLLIVLAHGGRFYTFDRSMHQKTEHKLVITGPYTCCQNPGYVSLVGTALGVVTFTIFYGSTIGCLSPRQLSLSCRAVFRLTEEKMLQEEFGEEYTKFQ